MRDADRKGMELRIKIEEAYSAAYKLATRGIEEAEFRRLALLLDKVIEIYICGRRNMFLES